MICDSPIWILPKFRFEKVPVPCGRCPPCKHRRINSWVFRLMQESKVHDHSWFVTLTYDTHHVPLSDNGFMTLRKKDFQDYMKRLRFLTGKEGIKYYAAGEYGTNNKRPHYHAIIFGVDDPQYLVDAWSLSHIGIGHVHIGNVTGDSIAYTAKYIDKGQFKRMHSRDDRVPEFSLMSKGLGENYLSRSVVKYHKADLTRLYVTKDDGYKIALPKYYRQKIYSDIEMKLQTAMIDANVSADKQALEREYHAIYGYNNNFTFDDWLTSKKFGRINQYDARVAAKSRSL